MRISTGSVLEVVRGFTVFISDFSILHRNPLHSLSVAFSGVLTKSGIGLRFALDRVGRIRTHRCSPTSTRRSEHNFLSHTDFLSSLPDFPLTSHSFPDFSTGAGKWLCSRFSRSIVPAGDAWPSDCGRGGETLEPGGWGLKMTARELGSLSKK
eukprot:COSAG02_NODE_1731_length_11173_cov_6.039281_2_plen_153_part_00